MILYLTAKTVGILRLFGLAEWFVNLVCGGEKFSEAGDVYNPIAGKINKRLILELPGKGCAWFKKSGGCTMCGFNKKLEAINQCWRLSPLDLTALYKIAELLSRTKRPEILCIFNGGSFLNEDEIPLETQIAIAEAVKFHPTFQLLFVESRPEFITNDKIYQIAEIIKPKRLEVGIGLEAVTDKVREDYIHKGFSLPDYEKAVKVLRDHKVYILTYVFLKSLYLSERSAIEEAVRTIEYAFKKGADEVSLSCAFIQKGTQMAAAYEKREFRPPWLWSIIEVVSRTTSLGAVRIGSFKDVPPPIAIPHNCPKCSQEVEDTLQEYNLLRDITVFDKLSCECKRQWFEET